jgi:hypothetical protein
MVARNCDRIVCGRTALPYSVAQFMLCHTGYAMGWTYAWQYGIKRRNSDAILYRTVALAPDYRRLPCQRADPLAEHAATEIADDLQERSIGRLKRVHPLFSRFTRYRYVVAGTTTCRHTFVHAAEEGRTVSSFPCLHWLCAPTQDKTRHFVKRPALFPVGKGSRNQKFIRTPRENVAQRTERSLRRNIGI